MVLDHSLKCNRIITVQQTLPKCSWCGPPQALIDFLSPHKITSFLPPSQANNFTQTRDSRNASRALSTKSQATTRWLRRHRRYPIRIRQQDERRWKWFSWGQEATRSIMAYISDQSSAYVTSFSKWHCDLSFPMGPGSKYIYDLYYDKEAISKQLYEWLLKNKYADGNLIAKWKKQGYEKVRISRVAFLCKTDGARIAVVLPTMHTDKRDELQRNVHLSSAADTAERGSIHRVCELWVSRLFFCWLIGVSMWHDEGGIFWSLHSTAQAGMKKAW